MASMEAEQDLPGFRFHPTEQELLDFYLSRVALGERLHFDIIGTLNIYRHDPWDLPEMAKIGEREWYFFVPRDRKGGGGRPNRTTERGFWKATGSDRAIRSSTGDGKRVIGLKKTLVFYHGRAPRGSKTDWVMNEYRLPDHAAGSDAPVDYREDVVLCKIYRKATPLKELEQRASAAEEMVQRSSVAVGGYAAEEMVQRSSVVVGGYAAARGTSQLLHAAASAGDAYLSPDDDVHDDNNFLIPYSSSSSSSPALSGGSNIDAPMEANKEADVTITVTSTAAPASHGMFGMPKLQQLPSAANPGSLDVQLPAVSTGGLDWLQDPFLMQLRSPWQEQHCLFPYAHLLYY